MTFYFRLVALASIVILSSSCDSGLKRSLGISHRSPDEYSVLKNAPLSVPPTFELTPPSDTPVKRTSKEDQKISFSKYGSKKTELKKETNANKVLSEADKGFMKKFNSHEKRKDIRDLIEEDAKATDKSEEKKESGGAFSKIKSWF